MIDPWQHILKSLEPEIDFLKMALENGPKILPRLEQNKKAAWQVCFSPVWSDATVRYYDDIDHKFDKRISWAAEELEKSISYHNWPRQKNFLSDMAKNLKQIENNVQTCDELYSWHQIQENEYWPDFKYKFKDLWPEYST